MKQNIYAAVAFMALCLSANAAILDFESLPAGECANAGTSFSTGGFNFTATSNTSSAIYSLCTGSPVSNGLRFSSNGTNVLGLGYAGSENVGAAYTFARADAAFFSLQSLDLAEFFKTGDFAFGANATSLNVVGYRNNLQVALATLTPDGITDGPGGVADFQTFLFSSAFNNVDKVTIFTFNTGGGSFGNVAVAMIDNVNVGAAAAPEPSTFMLTAGAALAILLRSPKVR